MPETPEAMTTRLEQEWDDETGFLGLLRRGHYDAAGEQRFLDLLAALDFDGNAPLNRRMVALLWFIPTFMEWQRERVQEIGGSEERLMAVQGQVIDHLFRLLGTP